MTDRHPHTAGTGEFSLRKRLFYGIALFALATVAALGLAEILLRALPIRGITYQTFYYDDLTGGIHYPHSTLTYLDAHGKRIERRINAWGFADIEHTVEKPAGVYRIGFFGDSYTEARQVPLDETFFRRVQNALDARAGRRIEVLAFGVTGRSTLQSYLECNRWLHRAALDMVVYVFSENDPADDIRSVTGIDVIPYAELSGDTFVVDSTFRARYGYKKDRLHRLIQFLKARSLVMSTIEQRLRLLRRHGVSVGTASGTEGHEEGLRATAPSSWGSDSLVTAAETLCGRIIERWRDDVVTSGARFVVMRVPRESQLDRPVEDQDAWAPWLTRFCDDHHIELVDPTPQLRAMQRAGRPPYGDHFTAAGHEAFADAFLDQVGPTLP